MESARLAMIADDVTGACDAGVQFAASGFSSFVWLNPGLAPDPAELLILPTNSRTDSPEWAQRKVETACRDLMSRGRRIVFKKVDSTMRGNIGPELLGAMRSCGFREAYLSPAFPAMSRTVREGWLYVGGHCTPIHLPTLLCTQGVPSGVKVFDAESQRDLAETVASALALTPMPLLAGSAGLATEAAQAFAARYEKEPGTVDDDTSRSGSVVLLVGSGHPATLSQMEHLRSQSGALEGIDQAEEAIRSGRPLIVRIDWEQGTLECLRGILCDTRPRGLLITGGDTAKLVCWSFRATGIRLRRELLRGIPTGTLVGGPLAGLAVATKSGGFGGPDALSIVAERL